MTVSVASSFVPAVPVVAGSVKVASGLVTFDSSYPTGGEAVTPEMFGLNQIHAIFCNGVSGRFALWNQVQEEASRTGTSAKILLYTAIGTEAANASDQSSIVVPVLVIGV